MSEVSLIVRQGKSHIVPDSGGVTVSTALEVGSIAEEVRQRVRGGVHVSSEAAAMSIASLAVPLAVVNGGVYSSGEFVCPEFLLGMDRLAEIWSSWHGFPGRSSLFDGVVDAAPYRPMQVGYRRQRAMFFSGGVDSLYTFAKWTTGTPARRFGPLDEVIFVLGFDPGSGGSSRVPAADVRANVAIESARRVATAHDATVTVVETDARTVVEGHFAWRHMHGPVLAGIGHLLSTGISHVIVAATEVFGSLEPWGTHPLTDHLFSSKAVRFLHDGCERTRLGKVEWLVQNAPELLTEVRVCSYGDTDAFNCGLCQKCMQTQICLAASGFSGRAPFDLEIGLTDTDAIARADFDLPNMRRDWKRLADELERRGQFGQVVDAMRAALTVESNGLEGALG